MNFSISATDGGARVGKLEFARGTVDTPAFMPVGTYGTVKAMTPQELHEVGAQIILGNTFHLMLRPGMEIIKKHNGLHNFMQWQGPILTDSGGFQVFSLAQMRKLTKEGVTFQSPIDGAKVFLSPEIAIEVQQNLDADIIMVLDVRRGFMPSDREVLSAVTVRRTNVHIHFILNKCDLMAEKQIAQRAYLLLSEVKQYARASRRLMFTSCFKNTGCLDVMKYFANIFRPVARKAVSTEEEPRPAARKPGKS